MEKKPWGKTAIRDEKNTHTYIIYPHTQIDLYTVRFVPTS